MTTLAMIHTGPVVVRPLNDIARRELPGVRIVNLMDDSIVSDIERSGAVGDTVRNRLDLLGKAAVEAGADAILVTCSSISELTDGIEEHVRLPVFKIDEAMAERAVELGARIAVIATLPTTLNPTCDQIERKAREIGRSVELRRELCREAFDSLSAGDEAAHDRIIRERIDALSQTSDVIVLAQASMARIVAGLGQTEVPVLTSPELGIERVRTKLGELGLPLDAA